MTNDDNTYYPMLNEDNFQSKLLAHSEFHELIQSVLDMSNINTKEKLSILKARLMNQSITLKPYQEYVARFLSSFTPYDSLLLFHSPGSGKTLSLLNIIKSNIDYFVNQNSLVYVYVPRKLLKMQWLQSVQTYFPELTNYVVITTYKSLYNKVLGERRLTIDEKTLKQSRKHITRYEFSYSEYENSILVFEEAHNITNNNYTLAINKLRENVKNKKTICLTATPIKNTVDEIIDLFNFLHTSRHLDKQDYFTYVNGRAILKNKERLRKDITGYVSTLNINDSPYLARRIQIGEYVDKLTEIKVVKVKCTDPYRKIMNSILLKRNDSLGKVFESISNILLPYIINGKLSFVYGNRGYDIIVQELLQNGKQFNKTLCRMFNIAETVNLLSLHNDNILTGTIFTRKYIGTFAPKMRFLYDLIERLHGNIFIYSSYKKIFIDLFIELLINEGYQNYRDPSRGLDALKKCYSCGIPQHKHVSLSHVWQPLSFLVVDSSDTTLMDSINVYNSSANMDGRYIRIILASVMINEGISLKNTIHVVNVDAQPTMSRKEQIERRVIRLDSHDDYILRNNKIPDVFVYNLALYHDKSTVPSIEIQLYKLAESKYSAAKEMYELLESASIDTGVYTSKRTYTGPVVNTTRSLVTKDNRIEVIIKYIETIFSNIHVISYSDLFAELRPKFNEVSILISMQYLINNEKIFVVSMHSNIYIFSNLSNVIEHVDKKFLDIHEFYSKEKKRVSNELYYDLDYISSKNIYDICGIVSDTFKLKLSNDFINLHKLDFVITKSSQKRLMKGWICNQSITKPNLEILSNYFQIHDNDSTSKRLCEQFYSVLFEIEKYSNDNRQFLIYPKNHPQIPSVLNIYDRVNITSIQYESKGYKVDKRLIESKDEYVKLDKLKYKKVKFELSCSKPDSDVLKITVE
jgi:hypothetical protein